MEEKEQMKKTLFSSESVTEGHPDKLCDQISDAILDAVIAKDPNARVAVETTATTGMVMVMGEMTTDCYVDIPRVIRDVIVDIGYDKGEYGFDGKTCAVLTAIDEQSPDIAIGVNKALDNLLYLYPAWSNLIQTGYFSFEISMIPVNLNTLAFRHR
jgi:S-adenosylmethionine synthetase